MMICHRGILRCCSPRYLVELAFYGAEQSKVNGRSRGELSEALYQAGQGRAEQRIVEESRRE